MSDNSPISIKERIIASVWVHDRRLNGKTLSDIMNDFEVRFHKKSSNNKTVYADTDGLHTDILNN